MQKPRKAIEIKISTVVAVLAILRETDTTTLDKALKDMTGGMTDYFEDEFAVLDVSGLTATGDQIDWAALVALFKRYRLNAVAVRNAAPELHADILAHGLSIDSMARPQEIPPSQQQAIATPQIPAPAPTKTVTASSTAAASATAMIIDTPVRAGQRIYARGTDLIIMAAVNNGSEVIADGSIHVYAPLRGRALAGASGNADARIFTSCLEAELVSIAGVYRTFEHGYPEKLGQQQVQIRLNGERIDVLALSTTKA